MNHGPQIPHGAPPQRKPSTASGCLVAIGIVGAMGAAGTALLCYAVSDKRTAAEKAHDRAVLDTEIAKSKAEKEAAEAKVESDLRRACKVPDGGAVYRVDHDEIRDECRARIRASTKVPGSEDFPSEIPIPMFTDAQGCVRIYRSTFTAKNVLGVVVRSSFECTFDPRTGGTSLKIQ